MKIFEDVFFMAPFLVSTTSHEMFVKENRKFWGGYRKIGQ